MQSMAADTISRPGMTPGTVSGLAILDVRHTVEERHLRNWLQGENTGASAARPSICVSLPISSESRDMNLVRLSELLAAHEVSRGPLDISRLPLNTPPAAPPGEGPRTRIGPY